MKSSESKRSSMQKKFNRFMTNLSKKERAFFIILILGVFVGAFGLLGTLNKRISTTVPSHGGSFREGLIGTPRFINPVLASSNTDQNMTRLVYSGLMRETQSGIVPDIAETYSVSDDGLAYTFKLRPDVLFHDGKTLDADDVIFTIETIQDSTIKSPLRTAWTGIQAQKIDQQTVTFVLDQPHVTFLEMTTLGILPKHLWQSLDTNQFDFTDLNIRAIGSGPYKIKRIKRNKAGIAEEITLKAFNHFKLGKPFIKQVQVRFFANDTELVTAFEKGAIDAIHAIDPETAQTLEAKKKVTVHTAPLPRVFGVFFNQNENPIFLDSEIVEALDTAINKNAIIARVLYGYGTPLSGPLPPETLGYVEDEPTVRTSDERLESAGTLLDNAGWTQNEEGIREKEGTPLAFTLATDNTPELKEVATMIKEQLEPLGVVVEVQIFETGNLEQDIIRPRKYQALLFGQMLRQDTDLYSFWHSSGRNDPGLNIALYTNTKTDEALTEAVETLDPIERSELYRQASEQITDSHTALFIYSPDLLYVTHNKINNINLRNITQSADRWNELHTWFIQTHRLWTIFNREEN